MRVKIYGYGWVGKAMHTLFPDAVIHDPEQGHIAREKADVAFVCVPTPLDGGNLNTSIVRQVVEDAQEDLIIIRSTVMPGTCDKLEALGKNVVFQPEFLGETPNHPLLNEKNTPFMVLGGKPENRRKAIDLYTKAYNANITIRQLTNYEAEIAKLTENRAIGFKVMQLHELYLVCEKAKVDYYTIRDTVYGDDPRFNLWFSFIYPGNLGFNSSKCLVKDIPGWVAWAESIGFDPEITKMLVRKSNDYGEIKV
jgi:UDPglucose 6-dehydrogenase